MKHCALAKSRSIAFMNSYLVIVESPTKIKTLRKFLGNEYSFESSLGHIRDLPKRSLGIDLDHDFAPEYVVVEGKTAIVERLKRAARGMTTVYLCPDPDREGEAIAWHIGALLGPKVPVQRVTFNSITKEEVLRALSHPRQIDMDLVNAQQARRILDRLVGYTVSPVVAKRFQGAGRFQGSSSLSAGRVQSVALKLVVDREAEIERFQPIEYWVIHAHLHNPEKPQIFKAMLWRVDGKRVEKESQNGESYTVHNEQIASNIKERLEHAQYCVAGVERKEKKRHPVPPFTTSTLQQEASRHFGFSATRAMRCAQGLYEGIDLGSQGSVGLITYMRTDSVRIAPEALGQARRYLLGAYGESHLPQTPRQFTSRKSAQDAHECIRPTDIEQTPEKVRAYLDADQFKLYSLIWKRFASSQMASAVYDTAAIDVDAAPGIALRATGSILKFAGFLAVYEEKVDDELDSEHKLQLPDLKVGQPLDLDEVDTQQSFTKPPPRYSEASLVKELEKSGIGRPSTYAAIMGKIQSKSYTVKEANRLKPTELGRMLAKALETHFPMIMDVGFTAKMEDQLEEVSEQHKEWTSWLSEFWEKFHPLIEQADEHMAPPREDTERECPKCGKHLQKIWYRDKFFLGCSAYPECDFRSSIEAMDFDKGEYEPDFKWDQPCPKCQSAMKVRHGRYGAFLGCEKYPDCRGIVQIPKRGDPANHTVKVACPARDCPGQLVGRRSRFNKVFYACSTYPDCDVIGPNPEAVMEKYRDHPRTPSAKKPTASRSRGKQTPSAASAKKGTKTAAKKGAKAAKTSGTSAKSTGEQLGAKKAKAPPKKAQRASTPGSLMPSAPLKSITGEGPISRPEALKRVWHYIKEHNLQDASDRRYILADDSLKGIFPDQPRVHMMKIAGGLTPHLKEGS